MGKTLNGKAKKNGAAKKVSSKTKNGSHKAVSKTLKKKSSKPIAEKKFGPYLLKPIPFPKTRHESRPLHKESVKWNAKKHLQWEDPEWLMSLNFDKAKFPQKKSITEKDGVAYSAPFRVLSEEGTRCLRKTVDDHEEYIKRNER